MTFIVMFFLEKWGNCSQQVTLYHSGNNIGIGSPEGEESYFL